MKTNRLVAAVLSGGQSRRMGEDKALLQHHGVTLMQNSLDLLEGLSERIIISGREEHGGEIGREGIQLVTDLVPDIGPLGGIYSVIKRVDAARYLFIAVDMPFLTRDLLTKMIATEGNAVVEYQGEMQPVCCLLQKDTLPVIEKMVNDKRYSIKGLFSELTFRTVAAQDAISVQDIDTPAEKDQYLK